MKKILIADDMVTVQHNLSLVLESHNYDVVGVASNCSEAISLFRDKKPDIVLLDVLGMASFFEEENRDIDSFEVINIISRESQSTKIIILTASPKEEYLKKALMAGAKGFLVKGVSNEKLVETIENVAKK